MIPLSSRLSLSATDRLRARGNFCNTNCRMRKTALLSSFDTPFTQFLTFSITVHEEHPRAGQGEFAGESHDGHCFAGPESQFAQQTSARIPAKYRDAHRRNTTPSQQFNETLQ